MSRWARTGLVSNRPPLRAVPWRHPPRKRDHDGGRSATDRLDLFDPRACGPRSWVHAHQPDRVCPRRHRQSAAADCGQCGRAIRVRAAVRQTGGGADASDGDLATDRYRALLPAYGRADKRAMAADDAARRSGPAPAGLNSSSRVAVDAASPSIAANPTLKVKARMLAPARAVAPACIKVLRTSSVASPKLSIRDWFHSQAADLILGPDI